jgi:hypothetical protein
MSGQMSLLAVERCPRQAQYGTWSWPCARRAGHAGSCMAEPGSPATRNDLAANDRPHGQNGGPA